ncbi:hypothetical protein AB0I68_33200 [Streptomyces sp. NPDC050448]|uniref:hypothetical protein n=1 Tax=Streptomyces sp. NPDC050448 TaxID=3155404 RepID=UPI00341B73F3
MPALRTGEVLRHAAAVPQATDGAAEAEELVQETREVVARNADLIRSSADRDRFLRDVSLDRGILGGGQAGRQAGVPTG